MTIGSNKIVFNPIIPFTTMIFLIIVLLLIVLINRKHIINRILVLILLLIISQRPMLRNQDDISYVLNFDVIFVVDTTVSMNAVDVNNGTRLEAVKKTANHIIEELPGSRFSVITYSNDAYIKYPFTTDISVIENVIDNLKVIDPNYAIGSSLSLPNKFIRMLLDPSIINDDERHKENKKIIFFFGDGELNNSEKVKTNLEEYSGLSEIIDNGAVIGVGTKEGSKIKITSSVKMQQLTDGSGYLLDNSVSPPIAAISKMNEDNLNAVATKLGIDYFKINEETLQKEGELSLWII